MFTVIALLGAALAIDALLAADAKLAMKRADLTLDYVSRVTSVPLSRLSDQLNGKTPFTSFWRFFAGEMRDTDFRLEFLDIQAARVDRFLAPRDLGALITGVQALVGHKRMAKADLPLTAERRQA